MIPSSSVIPSNTDIFKISIKLESIYKDTDQEDIEILLSDIVIGLFENHFRQLKDEVKKTLLDDMFEKAKETAFDVLADARRLNETKF